MTQKLNELPKLLEEKSEASLQMFKESEEVCKDQVDKFGEIIENKLENKLSGLNTNSYKTEHFDLNFLAFIIFCMFALFSYYIFL